MKLISMHVDDFGGLHNYDYNFEEGLNVVLHDNGWGKTTMASFLKASAKGVETGQAYAEKRLYHQRRTARFEPGGNTQRKGASSS